MPRVDLHSREDYASIFYSTNTQHSNVGGFDPEKPTIVMLHPVFLDSTWLDLQLGDTRFTTQFNIIAFDMRSAGQSVCRPSGRHDAWVDAADLAFCFQYLHLPPSHILALEGTSVHCALRFAVLFPEWCLSLTLVNVPAFTEQKWIYQNIDEMVHAACFADDMDHFQQAAYECVQFLFGPNCDKDLMDELMAYWELNHPPSKRVRVAETTSLYINRTTLDSEALVTITQPVLIIQGEKNELCPLRNAEKLASQLTGVAGGAVLYDVKGATSMISVVPGPASIVNNVFFKFLNRLPHHRSELVAPESSIRDRMRRALANLADLMGDPDIASLDPLCSLSFSCLPPDVVQGQADLLKHYQKGQAEALSPEIPLRTYSQRVQEGWSYSEIAASSRYNASIYTERSKHDHDTLTKHSSRSDLVPAFESANSSLQKMVFVNNMADKRITKGKATGNTATITSALRKLP